MQMFRSILLQINATLCEVFEALFLKDSITGVSLDRSNLEVILMLPDKKCLLTAMRALIKSEYLVNRAMSLTKNFFDFQKCVMHNSSATMCAYRTALIP